jgi:hypothetical protein
MVAIVFLLPVMPALHGGSMANDDQTSEVIPGHRQE